MARIIPERRGFDDDFQRVFDRFATPANPHGGTAECRVPLDVIETPTAIEVVMDLAGVPADAVQVVVAHNTLVVTGNKPAPGCAHHHEAAFHVAERTFGRFARAVQLAGAFDVSRAAATLRAGELRITLPRIDDRRGREHRIPVRTD